MAQQAPFRTDSRMNHHRSAVVVTYTVRTVRTARLRTLAIIAAAAGLACLPTPYLWHGNDSAASTSTVAHLRPTELDRHTPVIVASPRVVPS